MTRCDDALDPLPRRPGTGSAPVGRRAIAMGPAADPGPRGAATDPGRPLRVVVVEDEALIALDIEMTLEALGAEVVGRAATAAEAVRLVRLYQPDLVTMDIHIKGGRDGVSAAIELYEQVGIRAIFISAYGNAETRARAASANPIDWIGKPFDERALERALHRIASGD